MIAMRHPQDVTVEVCGPGIAHLMGSLSQEARQQQLPISIHTLSPGMVLTNLLLEGASGGNKASRARC